jgi:hypothetical protein
VLHLRNYRGRKIPDSEARIHQGGLLKDGVKYSMSNLARKLFNGEGYHVKTVSGPVYWFTENNDSIKNLWDDYLEKIAQKSEA